MPIAGSGGNGQEKRRIPVFVLTVAGALLVLFPIDAQRVLRHRDRAGQYARRSWNIMGAESGSSRTRVKVQPPFHPEPCRGSHRRECGGPGLRGV